MRLRGKLRQFRCCTSGAGTLANQQRSPAWKAIVEVLARTWKEGYATGVMHERMRATYPKHNIPQPKNPFEEMTEEAIMAKLDDMGQIQGQTTIYDHLGIQDPQKKDEKE